MQYRIPPQLEEAIRQLWAASGINGDPSRFEVMDTAPRRGTLHPLPKGLIDRFPIAVAMLVLELDGDEAVVCPIVVPPDRDSTILEGDRWLMSDDSHFRLFPETWEIQVRLDWAARISIAGMQPAVRIIKSAHFVADPPVRSGRRQTPDFTEVPDWSGIWQEVVAAMR